MASSNNFIYSPNKFDEAFKKICDLVDRFKKERPDQSPDQMEYEARVYYIDRFFEALGWDVRGEDPNSYYAREVQFEYRVKVAHHTKRADYLFSASTKDRVRRFLVEAKKPWENLEREDFYFQAVRYGYSSRTPVVILTNFKEFHVLDCRYTPTKTQILHRCRNKYSLDEYLDKEKFREIYNVFSKEGANQGSIKNLVENWKALRGKGLYTGEYKDVDEKFLEELDMHRLELAKAFKKTNPNFDGATLTEAVQRTLDRLVFLRFLEDKGIEQQEHVSDFALSNSAWSDFIKLCRDSLKHKYNGLIFNEHRLLDTKDFKGPDEEAFKKTCDDLSRENTPYAFDLIPIEILGSIYERFLGKVVTTSSQRAKVEEKPEVRKAGGVYYTPQYIVEYIVKNTVGEKIKDHSPDQIAKMRFADIACGSGSFLLGVYTLLLGYHTKYYNEHPEKIKKGECEQAEGGRYKLSLAKKGEILKNNLFGVDIDPQAVEVAQMSLYLKMLEEANVQLHLEFNQILPPMGQNIKCGNSLIGTDYFTSQLIPDPNEMRRVNPFDWGNEFPEIIKAGGFDCIVGNPPYIRIQVMKEWAPLEVEIYKEKYSTASSGNYDIYVVFVEKGLGLINGKGLLGFILPHKFFNAQYGETLRNLISKEHQLREVVHFGDLQIFDGASTYTCLMFLDKAGKNECQIERVLDLERWKTDGEAVIGVIPSKNITKDAWNFVVGENAGLFERLSKMPVKLEDVTDRIFQGIKTSADKIYIVEERERKNKKVKVFSPEKEKEYWLESDLLHPLIKGGDSKPFNLSKTNRLILFPYEKKGDAVELISQEIFKLRFPLTWAYLLENKHYLDDREKGRFKGNAWYQFGRSQALDVMPLPKIFTPDIATKPSFALDDNGELFFTGGAAGGYGILVSKNYSREFILGLLNSRLLEWFIRNSTTQMRGGWYSFESRFIKNLPILVVEDDKPEQVEIRDRIIELVKKIIPLSTDFYKTQSESDKGLYKRQIDSAVTEMNNLVNKLYGLTNEEIKFLDSNPK